LWQTLPISLNLRYPITFSWVADGIGAIAYVALGVALLACIVWRRRAPALVVLALAVFPLIYAWFPGAWFVGEGRYALFAAPFLALAIGWMVQRPTVMLATCVVAVGMSIGAIQHLGGQLPLHVGGDLRAMRAAGIEHAWAEYWIAYRLGFESGGWLSASPIAAQRDDELYDDVRRSTRPAFVFARDDARVRPLREVLGPGATVLRTPNFDVVVAPRAVDPTTLPPGTAP
jgi:hypothetical protein